MTEITNHNGSAQVVNLRPTAPEKSGQSAPSGKVESFVSEIDTASSERNAVSQYKAEKAEVQAKRDALVKKKDPLDQAAEKLQEFIPEYEADPNTKLRIDKDDSTGLFVYQNIDKDSGEVIRQFPPEQILEFLSY